MISRRVYWSLKYFNGLLANPNGNIGPILSFCDQPRRPYSSDPKKPDPGACCQDTPQTKGRDVEPWPKPDPPPVPWRCECPQEPQPVNYDPYRIRVPETVVPPLPPSNVKRTAVLLSSYEQGYGHGQGYQPQHQHQQPGHEAQGDQQKPAEEEKDEGLFGMLKNWLRRKKDKDSNETQNITGLEWNYVRDQ